MNARSLFLFATCAFILAYVTTRVRRPVVHRIHTADELTALAPILSDRRSDAADRPLRVHLAPGTYILHDSVRINRSRVTFTGEKGTRLVLAAGIDEPVLAIGPQEYRPGPTRRIRHVRISDLEIDGNWAGQTSETSPRRGWIRNNGIDVRGVADLVVVRVRVRNARSGGLVVSNHCRNVHVRQAVFSGNVFDGVACYESKGIELTDCLMTRNGAAGISLDKDLRETQFTRCIITDNLDVGVFARRTRAVGFTACLIRTSGNWAMFLGPDALGRGVANVTITQCELRENHGGIFVGMVHGPAAPDFGIRLQRSRFAANEREGRPNVQTVSATPLEVLEMTSDETGAGAAPKL